MWFVFTTKSQLANAKQPDDFIKYMVKAVLYLPSRRVVWEFCLIEFQSRLFILGFPCLADGPKPFHSHGLPERGIEFDSAW